MKLKKKHSIDELVIYQAKDGAIELRGDVSRDTIWASLDQIAQIFGRDRSVISRHLKNIYNEGELKATLTVAKNATVQIEGSRQVVRTIEYYNLDAILSVGYRVNSNTATQFRQWATRILREHITCGYTINRKRIGSNYDAFMKAVADVQTLLPEHITLDPKAVLDLWNPRGDTSRMDYRLRTYTSTFLYDVRIMSLSRCSRTSAWIFGLAVKWRRMMSKKNRIS